MEQQTRRKIKELEVMVADVIYETPDTRTLVLFTGNDSLEYKAGHFLTIAPQQFPALERWTSYLEEVKGKKEPPRAYSLSSAPCEKYLSITVKEERYTPKVTPFPPLLSPILSLRTSIGTRMVITGFTGPYTLPEDVETKTEHILHVCAGSGIVPSYSIIKQSLFTENKLKHTLIYSNKTWVDTIFSQQLLDLQKRFPDNFKVIFTLTREPDKSIFSKNILEGRVSKELILKHVCDLSNQFVFVCGPGISNFEKAQAKANGTEPVPRFLEAALQNLKEIGFSNDKIKKESYG
ncbi:oxidoreductase [bacterium]|nr:oxidoreductase [bacterium]